MDAALVAASFDAKLTPLSPFSKPVTILEFRGTFDLVPGTEAFGDFLPNKRLNNPGV